MKKSRYSDSQIIAIIKQAEAGTPVPELCREHGMSSLKHFMIKTVLIQQLDIFETYLRQIKRVLNF